MKRQNLLRRGEALFRQVVVPLNQIGGYGKSQKVRTKEGFDDVCMALALLEQQMVREMKRRTPLYQWLDDIEAELHRTDDIEAWEAW